MPQTTHQYSNGQVTLVWKPGVCIHSEICFKGLARVFDPRRRPWIEIDKTTSAEIIEQVKKYPSGALSILPLPADENEQQSD